MITAEAATDWAGEGPATEASTDVGEGPVEEGAFGTSTEGVELPESMAVEKGKGFW